MPGNVVLVSIIEDTRNIIVETSLSGEDCAWRSPKHHFKYLYDWLQSRYRRNLSFRQVARIHVLDIAIGTKDEASIREAEIGKEKNALEPNSFNFLMGMYNGKRSKESCERSRRASKKVGRRKEPQEMNSNPKQPGGKRECQKRKGELANLRKGD